MKVEIHYKPDGKRDVTISCRGFFPCNIAKAIKKMVAFLQKQKIL